MQKITVVGANSNLARFIHRKLVSQETGHNWRFISHNNIENEKDNLRQSDVVLNLSIHPKIMTDGVINAETNLDLKIARILRGSNAHYVMASSRKVYGDNPAIPEITVKTPLGPDCRYGDAKLTLEKQLSDELSPERLSIIRFTNIVGFNDFNQQGLVGAVFRRFAQKQPVTIDLDPNSPRDFLAQDHFSRVMIEFCQAPKAGTFNLGSGVGLPLTEIIGTWSKVFNAAPTFEPKGRESGFWLRSEKIHAVTGVPLMSKDQAITALRQEALSARSARASVPV